MLQVYIADDSMVVREKLREAFEERGSVEVVGTSGDAKQAIEEIRRLNPQVVIIDIRIPGGGGLFILKDVKSRPPERTTIILTSFPYPQYRTSYLAAGADYFFDKNKNIPTLTNILFDLASPNRGSHVEYP